PLARKSSILSAHNSRSSCLAFLVTRISSFPLMTSLSHQRRGARRYGWFDAYAVRENMRRQQDFLSAQPPPWAKHAKTFYLRKIRRQTCQTTRKPIPHRGIGFRRSFLLDKKMVGHRGFDPRTP